MPSPQKNAIRRRELTMYVAIALGLIIGLLVKRVRIGILAGLIIGILIIITGSLNRPRKYNE